MKITSETPKNWKELQSLVCKYLNESGYKAEETKTINLVRGNVEVDVYATADDELIKTFLCECKFWDSPIPKEKVHAFRSVISDSGATLGIIISKSGFQKGAVDAAYCSNVLLKNWDSFIDMISKQWLRHRIFELKHISQPLTIYMDPLDIDDGIFDDTIKNKYFELHKRYFQDFLCIVNLNTSLLSEEKIVINNYSFTFANELFDYLKNRANSAISEFALLLPNVDNSKFEFGGYDLMSMLEDIYNGKL